ncbi:MAG: hypothetical protein WA417_18640 [Stellaceae bacterium]
MKGTLRLAFTALLIAATAAADAALAQETLTAAAVWRPPAGFLTRFHAWCDGRSGARFDACFAAAMARAGASPAALDFTRRLGSEGYLQALAPTAGPVAVAHVLYPFRANENDAWLLVNGTPPLIDVDDRRNLSFARMRSSAGYAQIFRRYRNVTFWPGNRGAAEPEVSKDGRELVVGYLLRDLCHACAIVGRVRFTFDFDAGGRFLGARLVSVTPTSQ